MRLAAG